MIIEDSNLYMVCHEVVISCIICGLCRFLYSDEVQIGPETVMTTLYTAKKYAVPALEAHCVEFLKKNLRADNAFMLLTQVSFTCSMMISSCKIQHDAFYYKYWYRDVSVL